MTKMNDIDLVLLAGAAKRENGTLLPVPASVAKAGKSLEKAFASLLKLALIEERPAKNEAVWPSEGDDRIGLFITDAGRAAINVTADEGDAGNEQVSELPPHDPAPPRQTKSSVVVALLERAEGATMAEMIAATGWLPHTTRAALTGFRKKDLSIDKSKRGEESCYRIVAKG